jgi:drug/metabolite transporter (DMT)-like permease
MMPNSLIGALVGLVIALGFAAFSVALGRRVDLDDTRKALRVSALIQLIVLPVAGWFVAPAIFGD